MTMHSSRFDPTEPSIVSANYDPRSLEWPESPEGFLDLQEALGHLRRVQAGGLSLCFAGEFRRAQEVLLEVEVRLACLHDAVAVYNRRHARTVFHEAHAVEPADL